MANWFNGQLKLEGKLHNIRRFLKDQLVRTEESPKTLTDGILDLSEGPLHLRFQLPDDRVWINGARRMIVNETQIQATVESAEETITLRLYISRANGLDSEELLNFSRLYDLDIAARAGDFLSNLLVTVVIRDKEIIEVVGSDFYDEEEYTRLHSCANTFIEVPIPTI